jgi:hypothetical protein
MRVKPDFSSRVMTGMGAACRSHVFRDRLAQRGIRHIDTPKTNVKAERFIQTSLREWAYARTYQSSIERGNGMQSWVADYNDTRTHSALGGLPPLKTEQRSWLRQLALRPSLAWARTVLFEPLSCEREQRGATSKSTDALPANASAQSRCRYHRRESANRQPAHFKEVSL